MNRKKLSALVLGAIAVPFVATTAPVWSQWGGMMDGQTMQQMMGPSGYGYGPGWGGGPGMMRGGMMGGWGGGMMGPGMMGPGTMDQEWAMGGTAPFEALDLSDEQRGQIARIRDAERRKHWNVAGQIMDQQSRLRGLYEADQPDPKQVGQVYADISQLRRQMVETHVAADNEIQQLLTQEQREQLKQWRRGPGYGPQGGYGPGGMMGR
ncbi:hypothetical protein SVA_3280 [Sulfurifustis variabilis]|uniref:Zinc resistance-associated protein n=1 Tax=Sulfurifustis variabilis TaxID=1675686 RepID=A0A1C7AF26_9GAMM|nr:Spy/CpxP family protein refolding chaperone [Sulfurifustis variabilis]BAU49828.1 hypothetical protein SVA_3280 [Sulfurifustis variabilis]